MNAVIEVHEPEVNESVEGNQVSEPLVLGPPIEIPLFGDVLLETGELQRRRRGFSTVFSFLLAVSHGHCSGNHSSDVYRRTSQAAVADVSGGSPSPTSPTTTRRS